MTNEIMGTVLAERDSIDAERFVELLTSAVEAWEAEASENLTGHRRRGHEQGYYGGQLEAFGKLSSLTKLYKIIKSAHGNDLEEARFNGLAEKYGLTFNRIGKSYRFKDFNACNLHQALGYVEGFNRARQAAEETVTNA